VAPWQGRWFLEWARPGSWQPFLFTGPLDLAQDQMTCGWTAGVDWAEQSGGVQTASEVRIDADSAHLRFALERTELVIDLFRDGDTLSGGARWDDGEGKRSIPWSVVDGTRQWPLVARNVTTPWAVASPEQVKLDPTAIRALVDEAERTHSSGFVLVKDDRIVALAGEAPLELAHIASVSKALSSLAVPFLIAESKWKSIDEPLADALTEWRAPDPRSAITLRYVMSHTTGLETPDYTSWIATAAQDHEADVLTARLLQPPGTAFAYSNRAVELTSVLVQRLTGSPLDDYLRPRLLEPVQIDAKWWHDPKEHARVHAGVSINSIDLAKIGVLMRDGGKWQGRQVLPVGWVETATRPATTVDKSSGLGWFSMPVGHAFQHSGDSGAILLVVPDAGIVMARVHRYTRADEDRRLPQHSPGRLASMTLALAADPAAP
jgi:CubicO group peptidase (beta-lactamase class C family)